MKMNPIVVLAVMTAPSIASANGGLSINKFSSQTINDEQLRVISANTQISAHAPVDKFYAYNRNNKTVVDTNAFRHDKTQS